MASEEIKKRHKAAAKKKKVDTENESADFNGELGAPRWSVVSFETVAAKNLTYAEAVKKLKRLEAKKVSGLCIVTDEAAKRVVSG